MGWYGMVPYPTKIILFQNNGTMHNEYLQYDLHVVLIPFGFLVPRESGAIVEEGT
jgi:hypothetical protein